MKVIFFLLFSLNTIVAFAGDSLFKESDLVLKTSTGDINGTLTIPNEFSTKTVVLIIAGSGPTDRNGNNPMMKNESLRMLAHMLAKNGYASLRYDKRGIAESREAGKSEKDLRFDDYIRDAEDWLGLLKKDKRFRKLVVMGHSEGSMIGMVAAKGRAQAFVSLAGAGRPIDVVIKEQLSSQPKVIRDTSAAILDSLKAGKELSRVHPVLFSLFRPSVQPYMISWLKYDPQKEILKLTIPVLIVQGTKDIQVKELDAELLKKAAPKAVLSIILNMNHVLKNIEGGDSENRASYTNPELPLHPELEKVVISFLKKIK